MALTLALSRYETRRVLQFGVGGAYDRSSLQVGDLAVATNECYGDAGVITPKGWIDLQGMNLPLIPPDVDESSRSRRNILYNQIPMDIDLIKRVGGLLKAEAKQIREGTTDERPVNGRTMKERFSKDQAIVLGTFVTVQQCSGVKSVGDEMANRFAGICENMEGAAAAHVALLHEVSFAEIRGISNRVVDRDLSRWNLVLAARNSQHAIRAIVSAGL